jgi:hypothetical protein
VDRLDRYDGPFDFAFEWSRLSRGALARLGRELMLFAHLHDRGIMPLVGARFGATAMTELALGEWMGASPVYNRRNREQMGIDGDGVSAVFKGFQLDVGFPHQYMDVRYELVDESLGYFWLAFCGAYEDVFAHSRGREAAIVQLCHHMEDPTFDATVMAVNPRARARPEHRPPLRIGHTGPSCRWRVFLGDEPGRVDELPVTQQVAASRAGRFRFDAPESGAQDDGMADYAGSLKPDFALEDLAQPVLARQCKEFALDAHLLMRAAFATIRERWGAETALELAREQWAALAPVYVPRLREALGVTGSDMASILKTLQLDPAFPPGYVRHGCELVDTGRGRFWIEDCEALAEGEPEAWLALLADAESPGFDAAVAAVEPRARCERLEPEQIAAARGPVALAWEIRIDPGAPPRSESPLANAVRMSNAAGFRFR